ncbi:MAG: Fur family transcriptional regulator [Candidatus Limnocylindria bacterium]
MTVTQTTDIPALLRARGLRVTPQRRAVWAALEESELNHPSADDVFDRARRNLPELSRATVYNALRDFVEAGLLAPLDGRGVQRFDANQDPHQHFRCLSCGALHDVHPRGLEKLTLDAKGFTVERMRVVIEGLCPQCSQAG